MKWLFRLGIIGAVVAAAAAAILVGPSLLSRAETDSAEAATYEVRRRALEDRVVERGTIESQNTIYGRSELPGRNKIVEIVPEGTSVKKGDKVVVFETIQIDEKIQQKEIEVNEAEGKLAEATQQLEIKNNENVTNIAAAKLAYEVAVIDLRKYEEGDLLAEVADLERAIKDAESQLEDVRLERSNMELLVKKGYRSPQQLRTFILKERLYQFQVERDRQKLKVLLTYDREKKLIELRGKRDETELKLERAETTADAETKKAEAAVASAKNGLKLVKDQLDELRQTLSKCTLLAEQDGIVAYANEFWYDASERIRAGTEMWEGRNIYFLPDMTKMQVKASVHESVVEKVKEGQTVTIRLDAFSDVKLTGVVSSVANMAASTFSSIQNYETIILIDQLPEGLAVKPGMTAEVDILVGNYTHAIAVPIGAITEHFGQTYVYILDRPGSPVRRQGVKTGRVTHSFVEILEGVNVGEQVTLDAYRRGIKDFADKERAAEQSGPTAASSPAEPMGE